MAQRNLAVFIQRNSSYTHRTQSEKQNYQKLPCRSTKTVHKYSSIFQVFIVLIIQIKRHQKVALIFQNSKSWHQHRDWTSAQQSLVSSFLTSIEAFSRMYRPTSLMAPCPKMNYCKSTGYISNSFGTWSPIYTNQQISL